MINNIRLNDLNVVYFKRSLYSLLKKLLHSKLLHLKISMSSSFTNITKCNWSLNSSREEDLDKLATKSWFAICRKSPGRLIFVKISAQLKTVETHTNVGPRDKVTLKSRGINWSSTGIRSDNYLGDEAAPIKRASCRSRLAKTGPMLISKVYAGSEFHIEL